MEYRLEMAISRLRRKLAPASPTLEPIRAVRGVGYALTVPCVEQAEKLSK
jgi:DNA-binding response OmpR family regulator